MKSLLPLTILLFSSFNALTQKPSPLPKVVNSGVVNGKATSLPKPEYPAEAQAAAASGQVKVQVTIDEQGNVIAAAAVSGHQSLRKVSEEAARKAKFLPTKLSGRPVKVTGVIIYDFVPSQSTEFKEPYWALAMVISLIELTDTELISEIGDPQEFDRMLKEMPIELPKEFSLQKDLFLRLANAKPAERNNAAQDLRISLENTLRGHEAWQFEVGEHLGSVVVEMLKFKIQERSKKYLADEDKLRKSLQKIKELAAAPPTQISNEFTALIKVVGNFADDPKLSQKIFNLFEAIDPLFSRLDR